MNKMALALLVVPLALVTVSCNTTEVREDAVPDQAMVEAERDQAEAIRVKLLTVLTSEENFAGRNVIVVGFPHKVGRSNFSWWNFQLSVEADHENLSLLCYEERLHPQQYSLLQRLLRQAEVAGEPVRIGGTVGTSARLELDWVEVRGFLIDTDQPPSSINGSNPR